MTPDFADELLAEYPPAMTTGEVSDVLRCSKEHARQLRERGELRGLQRRAKKQGSTILILRSSVRDYLRRICL